MYQGAASWVDRDPGLPVPVPAGTSHEALKIRVTREPTVSCQGTLMECAYLADCWSLRGWNVAWAPGFLFSPAVFPRLPLCWNVRRLGRSVVRTSSSLSNKFQLEPGECSHMGIEATREGSRSARPVGTAMFSDLRLEGFQPPQADVNISPSLSQVRTPCFRD